LRFKVFSFFFGPHTFDISFRKRLSECTSRNSRKSPVFDKLRTILVLFWSLLGDLIKHAKSQKKILPCSTWLGMRKVIMLTVRKTKQSGAVLVSKNWKWKTATGMNPRISSIYTYSMSCLTLSDSLLVNFRVLVCKI